MNTLSLPIFDQQPRITPFDYQQTAIDSLFRYWQDNPGQYPLLVLPPGAGKTVIASLVMHRMISEFQNCDVLFLAHRKELIQQAEQRVQTVWPAAPTGVYAAMLKRREINRLTIASRDTIAIAIDDMPNYRPSLVIVDEAHMISHKEGTRYRKLIAELEERNPHMMLLGLTATEYRTNHGVIYGPDEVFHGIAYNISINELIKRGALVPLTTKDVNAQAKIQTDHIPTVNGDIHQGMLQEAAIDHDLINASINEWLRIAVSNGRKHTLFFCVSIAHAEAVQSALLMRGYDFPLVTGSSHTDERERAVRDFSEGRVAGLLNVGVFTEGTDIPIIDTLAIFRATRSLNLWVQICGRGTRTHEASGKEDCLVLDFGGNIDRFGPIDIAQPPEKRKKKADKRTKVCPECKEVVGFYRIFCPCGYQFKEVPHKLCSQCQERNPPSAGKCISCGALFAEHDTAASNGPIMSNGNPYRRYIITRPLSCAVLISKNTGKPYLQVNFFSSYNKIFRKRLFFGYGEGALMKAQFDWQRIAKAGTAVPATAEEAARIADKGDIFRPVDAVSVDTKDPGKPIKVIHFADEEDNT